MDEYTSARIESILNELVTGGEVFEKVFIIDVVDLDLLVREVLEEGLVQRASQDRQYMSDLGGLQGLLTAESKQPTREKCIRAACPIYDRLSGKCREDGLGHKKERTLMMDVPANIQVKWSRDSVEETRRLLRRIRHCCVLLGNWMRTMMSDSDRP
jgi:hypothetical protein